MKWLLLVSLLALVGCEDGPCKDVKLGFTGTQECTHPDHVLETHIVSPSVCRCKGGD